MNITFAETLVKQIRQNPISTKNTIDGEAFEQWLKKPNQKEKETNTLKK